MRLQSGSRVEGAKSKVPLEFGRQALPLVSKKMGWLFEAKSNSPLSHTSHSAIAQICVRWCACVRVTECTSVRV